MKEVLSASDLRALHAIQRLGAASFPELVDRKILSEKEAERARARLRSGGFIREVAKRDRASVFSVVVERLDEAILRRGEVNRDE